MKLVIHGERWVMEAHIGGTEKTGNPMTNSRLDSIEKCSYRDLNPGRRNESPSWWATTLYERGSFACIVLYLEMATLKDRIAFTFRFVPNHGLGRLLMIFTFTFHSGLNFLLIYGRPWISVHEQQCSNKLCWLISIANRYWGAALVPPNYNGVCFC